MASSVRKPEDWGPYEAEIRSLYLDQNWTLGKTMKHMELKYGFKATVRQYKRRFNKNKNLTTPEWIIIGKLIQQRSREGKRTDVLLYQRQVDPKKITRELARRKSQIDRAKTPVHEDDQVYGRTSFRTPPPSPGMGFRTRPSAEDDGDDLPWETYVALSPADSICSVSRVLRSETSDQDTEDIITQLSTPSPILSEIDHSDLKQLEIEFWTFNLPIAQLQNYLREQRHTSPSVLVYPLTSGHTVAHSISHSWSEDSLRGLLSEGLPQLFDVAFPAGVPYRKKTNALEIALFAMTNNLFDYMMFHQSIDLIIRIFKWVIEPAHLAMMDSLRKERNREFSAFAHSFFRLSSDLFCCLDEDESQERLVGIIHTLMTSRLPSNFFTSSETNRLLSAVAGYDYLNLVQSLVDNGASANLGSSDAVSYWNPLFNATQNRRLDVVQYLINQGADINFEDASMQCVNYPSTALGHALQSDAFFWDADHSNEEPASLTLLKYGADGNSRAFSCGVTALDWAAFNAPQVYDRLIQHDPTIRAIASVLSLIGRAAHNGPQAVSSAIQQHIYSSQDLEQALIFAIHIGSIKVARALLQANVDPNCAGFLNMPFQPLFQESNMILEGGMRYEDLYTPLRAALYHGTKELIELLIDFGADVTAREIDILWCRLSLGYGPLKDSTKVLWIIAHCGNRKLLGDLLLLATYFADRKLLTSLLETIEVEGSSLVTPRQLFIRSRRMHGPSLCHYCLVWTPLQVALARGDATLALCLWGDGFRFHVHHDYPYSPGWYELKLACECVRPDPVMHELIDIFLEHGATPNSPLIDHAIEREWYRCQSWDSIDTCLHSILREPFLGLLPEVLSLSKKLIEFEADLARVGVMGNDLLPTKEPRVKLNITLVGTIVQTACFSGLTDVVRLLADAGANIHAAAWPDRGRTALQAACGSMTPSLDLIQYLLDQQCDANCPPAEKFGVTALQAAATRGYVQIAIRLLTARADVNAPAGKINGKTAIEAAAEYGRLDMVKLLINAGALGDTEAENRFHEAIRLADLQGHQHIVELLREHQ